MAHPRAKEKNKIRTFCLQGLVISDTFISPYVGTATTRNREGRVNKSDRDRAPGRAILREKTGKYRDKSHSDGPRGGAFPRRISQAQYRHCGKKPACEGNGSPRRGTPDDSGKRQPTIMLGLLVLSALTHTGGNASLFLRGKPASGKVRDHKQGSEYREALRTSGRFGTARKLHDRRERQERRKICHLQEGSESQRRI